MRILTWNLNHRATNRKIPPEMAKAIAYNSPDVVVLTEYVHADSRKDFIDQLASNGLHHLLISEQRPKQNHVLIASRFQVEVGDIKAPEIAPSLPSNVLHARFPDEGFDVIGLRVPDYSKKPSIRREIWDWILSTAQSMLDKPAVLIGDFNTDPKYPASRCGDRIMKLQSQGWQHAMPESGVSYYTLNQKSSVCIDHAFLTRHFAISSADYIETSGPYAYVGKDSALSDHALLMIDSK